MNEINNIIGKHTPTVSNRISYHTTGLVKHMMFMHNINDKDKFMFQYDLEYVL